MNESGIVFGRKEHKPLRIERSDIGQRSETVRRANLSAIVRGLHERGAVSRSSLVAATGLTRSAIRGLVGELEVTGLVSETPAARLGTPGRPSPIVRLNPDRAVVLAVEIAVDSTAAAVVGLGGEVIRLVRADRVRGTSSPGDVLDDIASLVDGLRADVAVDDSLIGVGAAIVGVVRREDGLVTMAPNLGWGEVALAAELARRLGVTVPISVANEADLGVLAEHRRGAAIGVDDVLFVSGEVGVGGGIISGGRPLTGAAGFGGEIGHMPVNPAGSPCRCGSIGCWETEVGERTLLTRAGRSPQDGPAGVSRVLADAAAGSEVAIDALDHVGTWLGTGLAGLVNVLNPRLIVLGGLFGRLLPSMTVALERELARRALPASHALVRIVPATLGIDAPLLGAAELAFEPLLADPSAWMSQRAGAVQLATA